MKPVLAALLLAAALAGCAGPPLTLYTLAADAPAPDPTAAPQTIIAVARVGVPDALDTQDILVRDGATLKRSATSRWAERLSLGITDLMTAELARQFPQALVTDQPQSGPVTTRLAINISQLDVTTAGTITLAADWSLTPANPTQAVRRERTTLTLNAPTNTDVGTVQAMRAAIVSLAERIGAAGV